MSRRNVKVAPGQQYGRLTVVRDSGERRYSQIIWECICECGNTACVCSHSLTRGATRSCGCLSREAQAARREDISGRTFGRLTAISPLPNQKWMCLCTCGKRASVDRRSLIRGETQSCGCIRVERMSAMEKSREDGNAALARMRVDGTCIASIHPDRKINKNSSTGIKGVSRMGDKYRAYINYRGRQIYIGLYSTIEEAAEARSKAEKDIFAPVIDEWRATHS